MQIFDPPPERPRRLPRSRAPQLRRPRLPRAGLPAIVKRPLAWVIAAESLVTGAFVLAAVHLLSSSLPAASAAVPLVVPSTDPAATPPDASTLPSPAAGPPAPSPGLGEGAGFLGGLLSGLNRDQASFEHQEWSALQALAGAIRTYIEGVMLPAVEQAAHGSRSP